MRRRWPRIAAGILAVLVVSSGMLTVAVQYGLPWRMQDGDRNHVYETADALQRYQVHVPPQHDGVTKLPVVMAIHGCGMTGFGWNSMKATTQLNSLADREGFLVVYPTQRTFRNTLNCWNSADPGNQQRRSGEPALLAGVAREVVGRYNADPARVHVVGASSGAGTAVILGATYPDVFATVTSVAGGEYGLNQVDPDDPDATSPVHTARQAWAQMGEHARQVPLLVIQGSDDEVVVPLVATRLVAQWNAVNDLVDDGVLNNSPRLLTRTGAESAQPGRHGYTYTSLSTPEGDPVIDYYLVDGMGHAWPGPDGEGLFTDRAGPDASALAWDFAKRHPMA